MEMKTLSTYRRTKPQSMKVKPGFKFSQELLSFYCAVLSLVLEFALTNNI